MKEKRITLSSSRIHSLVLVAVDQWERRSESRTLRAFCDGDSRDMALTLNWSGFTRGSNSTSIFFFFFDESHSHSQHCLCLSLRVTLTRTHAPFYITPRSSSGLRYEMKFTAFVLCSCGQGLFRKCIFLFVFLWTFSLDLKLNVCLYTKMKKIIIDHFSGKICFSY